MAHNNHISCYKTWMSTLAKRHTASGAFIFSAQNQLLILKPSYKDGWNLPGGVSDQFESPYQTVIRECKEETNLDIHIKDLVLIDYSRKIIDDYEHDYIEFYFTATVKNLSEIQIDKEEIIDYKFVDITESQNYLTQNYHTRLTAFLNAKSLPVMFENCQPLKSNSQLP